VYQPPPPVVVVTRVATPQDAAPRPPPAAVGPLGHAMIFKLYGHIHGDVYVGNWKHYQSVKAFLQAR
jgi:hypothetical protein